MMSQKMSSLQVSRVPCPCCGTFIGDEDFYGRLDAALGYLGHAVKVTSGYRCARHNARVSKRSTGRHVSGQAVDILAKSPREKGAVLMACIRAGLVSFAILPGGAGLHVDANETPWLGIE